MTRLMTLAAGLVALSVALPVTAIAGDVACAKQSSLKSKNSNKPTKISFVNKTSAARIIMWINFNGAPEQFSILGPGQKFSVDTFLTHPWLIVDGPGNCIDIFMPTAKARTVNLTREPVFGEE